MPILSRQVRLRVVAFAAALVALWAQAALAQSFLDFGAPGRPAVEAEQEAAEPAPRDDPDRPPDLAAYGEIADTYRATSALDMTQRTLERFRERVEALLGQAPGLGAQIAATLARASPSGAPSFFLGLAAFLAFLIGLGRAVTVLYAVYVARPIFVGLQRPRPHGLADKLPVLATRVGLVIVGVVITVATASLIGAGFYPEGDEALLKTAIVVFAAYAVVRVVDTLWRMILSPFLPEYRVPALSDEDAVRLYRWLYAASLFGIVSLATIYWLTSLGLPREPSALLYIFLTALQVTILIGGVRANRRAISGAILGGRPLSDASWLAASAAALWAPGLIVYALVAWAEMSYRLVLNLPMRIPLLGGAFLVLLAGLVVYAVTVFLVERGFRRWRARRIPETHEAAPEQAERAVGGEGADEGPDEDGDDEGGGRVWIAEAAPAAAPFSGSRMRSFEDLARRVASLFALGAGVWALALIWVGDGAFAEGSVLDQIQDVTDILFIGYVLFHAIRIWIDQKIAEEGGDELDMEPGDEGGGASAASRLATLLPLVRNFVLALVAASVAIFVAMELGANVAPLLGGAGVLGLAIGFGSQTLVRDILSGAFFLLDDAFRKGEYIDIGDVKGTVEKISLRSFQLRHHLGALHTVPFGEVQFLTNFSRDWVMMKLPLRLTYDTDVEKVRKLIKKLGQKLLEHPTEGHKFLQPLKSQGVYQMEDSAMIVRVKFMTRPGDQWTTRKLVYAEIRELFAQEGIKFAHREVTVRIPELDGDRERKLSDGEMQAIGAAARTAVDQAEEEARPRPVAVGDDR